MKVINLLSGPRNISTALMYAFAQHPKCTVLDEPFYAYYLTHSTTNITHPGTETILASQPQTIKEVLKQINTLNTNSNVFVKGMAHHILMENPDFLKEWHNIILIRHPKDLLISFSKVISNPSLDDIGLKKAFELFQYLKSHGHSPLVIESNELLKNPKKYLKKICDALGILFSPKMLHWEKGGSKYDGVWASYWYQNVHHSTGFIPHKSTHKQFPKHLNNVLEQALPYYEQLQPHILKN